MDHKHKGVERSGGSLRFHPVQRMHKDEKVKQYHNRALTSRQSKYKQIILGAGTKKTKYTKPIRSSPKVKKFVQENINPQKPSVNIPIDRDGYISMDLEKTNVKGVRISFIRTEGRKKRTVALQIENEK